MENFAPNTQVHGYSLIKGFWCVFIFLFSVTLTAQQLSTENKKAKKLYEKADKEYKARNFSEAIALLEEATEKDPGFFEAYIRMGSLYNALGNEDSVYAKFQSYASTAPNPIASVLERLAFLSFDRGDYIKSRNYLKIFLDRVPERASSPEIDLLNRSILFAENELAKPRDSILVEELPTQVNRFTLQYLPAVTIDEASIYYTKRDQVSGDEDIVVSHKKEGEWQPAAPVSSRINSAFNEGACTVSADGRTMIFTSCNGRNSVGSCDLYITRRAGEKWSYPKNLGRPINTIYWESQPSLSADGKTLFFASNRRGGFGGRDLWYSKNIDGKWTEPKNLGKGVNTRNDETTPFIHPNNRQLYFSGNGYPGMGGYDLFFSQLTDSSWSEPKNLGYPINTHKDEVSIIISASGLTAYFAKEEQKNYQILDSKLVKIQLPQSLESKPVSYIVGVVTDATTNEPLRAELQVVSLQDKVTIYNSFSDSLSGEYYFTLPIGLDLAAYVKKKGYLYADFKFSTQENSVLSPDTINISLVPIDQGQKLILKNIYFEVDSYDLDEKSWSEIENAFQLIKENPGIYFEIAGHTDDTGSSGYNIKLSENRARAVYDALIKKGVSKDILIYKGYGDSQPINPNTTEFNRQSNRRIEFRVIRSNP